jgi:amino acid adenylation domain-containing protein
MKITDKKNIEDILPLTPIQQGMLFHYLQDRESDYYFEQLCLTITGEIDLTRFRQAWALVLETNEILRTLFIWERITKPMQVILKKSPLPFIYQDFSNGNKSENDKRNLVQGIRNNDRKNKFNLNSVPFRITLCKLGEAEYEMMISNHHILYDGWSNGILLKEFFSFYHHLGQKKSPQKPHKHKYKEYISWIQGQDVQKQRDYWACYLKGFDTKSELSIKRIKEKNINTTTPGNSHYHVKFSRRVGEKLEIFIKSHKITLAGLLYSAWGILLQRYNNSEDVVFGTTVSGRPPGVKGIEDIVGLFINTVPLRVRTDSSGHEKIKDFLSRVNQELRERETYESASLVEIKEYGQVGFAGELFDTILVIENYPLDKVLLEKNNPLPLSVDSYSMFETTHYDLTVGITLIEDIEVEFIYNEDLFDETIITGLSRHFVKIVEDMVDNPGKELAALEILSEAEKYKVLYEFNNTAADYGGDKTIQQLFAQQVERLPDHIALVGSKEEGWKGRRGEGKKEEVSCGQVLNAFGVGHLSYRELNKISCQLAYILKEKGVGHDSIVALMLKRSLEMMVGILGILKAGGAYLPIDPDYPQERVDYMLKDSRAKILLTGGEIVGLYSPQVLYLSEGRHPDFPASQLPSFPASLSSNLAYIIYTSGTTGEPRGVMIPHSAVMNRLFWVRDKYRLNERDVILQATSFVFDVSVCEMFRWIPAGGKLCLLTSGGEVEPGQIVKTIARHQVTTADFVPSLLNLILDHLDSQRSYKELSSLRWLFTGAEIVGLNLVKRFNETLNKVNNTRLINAYGPTESTVDVTYFDCSNINAGNGDVVPIGRSMANVRVYILARNGAVQPVGIYGQLCIAGKALARGYLNNPELTNFKFQITNKEMPSEQPMQSCNHASMQLAPHRSHHSTTHHSPLTIYYTGDLARWLPDGNIEFLGRMDYQVKIRGFRIELGEIEGRLLKDSRVKEAVVLFNKSENEENYLCAYLVTERRTSTAEIRRYLSKHLPDYMIPSYFVQVENIPRTPGGKVDRKALPEPEMVSNERYVAPRNEIEKTLTKIWAEVLGEDKLKAVPGISIEDNFFHLGGHSLKATILSAKIHKTLRVKLSIADIFKNPRLREQAEYIQRTAKILHASIEPAEEKEYYPLSPAQKRLYVLHQMIPGSVNYNMPMVMSFEKKIQREKIETIFKILINRHESLRTSFEAINEKPVQRIYKEVDFSIGSYEITGEEDEHIIANFLKTFDLNKPPLLRAAIANIKSTRQILYIDMHHIITDGTSQDILQKEFMALYSDPAPGSRFPPLKLQYKDYSEWVKSREKEETIKKQEVYWQREFAGEIPVLELPIDYPRPLMQSFAGNKVYFTLEPGETKTLKIISRENDVTLYMTLLAVFSILFLKLSGQEDIIVGTPIAARPHTDLQQVIGMMVNSLPMRNFPSPAKTFRFFLKEVKQRTLDAYENQEYPFEELVEKVSVYRDTSRNPIFDIMFAFQNQVEEPGSEEPGYEGHRGVTTRVPIHKVSRFDLAFDALESEGKIQFCLEYCTKLFKPTTVEKFIKYYKKIIAEIAKNREQKLAEIEIISGEEKEEILRISNGEEESGYQGKPLHQWFEQQVEKTPHRLAVTGTRLDHISYEQLNREANRLAHLLREKGAGPGGVVGVMMERSVEMIIAILAVLKAGGAYLPIDPQLPGQRLKIMLADSGALLLLTSRSVLDQFSFSYTDLKNLEADDKNLVITPPRSQIKELESLPIIDRTLVDYEKYLPYVGLARAKNTVSLQATRGCPYHCLYCHKIWPKKHMMRSAGHIFEEVRRCYEAGMRRFSFVDDIFNLHEKNSGEFLRKIINHGLDVQLYFPNGLRGDILTKDFIDLMIEAGTIVINLALETASPRLQKRLGKNLNLEKFQENVHYIANKYPQVVLDMELMIGFPTETEEEAQQTLEMLKSFKWIHFPGLNILKIYPNTDMYRFAIESGVTKKSIARSTNLAYQDLPETLPFSKNFTRQYQARFMKEYFLLKERLLDVLPVQMATATEDELVQKYNSYLPVEVKSFSDILHFAAVSKEELGKAELKQVDYMDAPGFNKKIRKFFPGKEKNNNAFKILLLDLSLLFSRDSNMFFDMIEEPLGLMALLTYLDKKFTHKIQGKIAKSRIDFDSYEELKALIADFKPGMIGIRTLTYYKEFFHKTVLLIRQWGFKGAIAAGGPYATSDYTLLLQDDSVDLVVMGEGESTFAHLMEKVLENDNRLPGKEILSQIPGIVFAKGKDKVKSREIILPDEVNISGELAKYPVENLENIQPANNLLYLIYTSGSTGNPKGVMLEQQNLINLIHYQFKHTNIDFSRVLQFTTISFDVSAQEIFSTLLSGGQLFLIHKDTLGDIPSLFKVVKNNNIRTLFLPASFLKFVSSREDYIKLLPSCSKHIVTAGEQAIINDSFKRFLQRNNVYFHNHYGPSETHVVTALTLEPRGEIPALPAIGRPVANTGIYLLDKGLHLVPLGVPGEIFIGGSQVGWGYANNPELTSEKFLPLFHKSYRSYIYRTGDLARWLPDGNIEFLGRIDHQVKIRGFRIELEEIENHLLNHEEIKDAVVVVNTDKKDEKHLCAYICSGVELGVSELREYLAVSLPDYMIPAYFVFLEKIPLTSTGKVDRKALPQPGIGTVAAPGTPRDNIEMKLTEIWSEVLGVKKELIGIDAIFFELGGHSLNATIMASIIHKELKVKVPLAEIFRTPHIRGLSGYIKTLIKDTYTPIEPVEKKEYYILSSAQERLYIAQRVDLENTAYNLSGIYPMPGWVDIEKFNENFDKLINRHESLRTSFHMIGDKPVQKIEEKVEVKVKEERSLLLEGTRGLAPLSNAPLLKEPATRNSQPVTALISSFIRPFDLSSAPLLRVGLIKMNEATHSHILMVDMHHIISDEISHNTLLRDFFAMDAGEALAPLRIQYKDYAQWQKLDQTRQTIARQSGYWLEQLKGKIPGMHLPLDFPRPDHFYFEGNTLTFILGGPQDLGLKKLANDENVTLFILLLAIFNVMLAKICGQEDIVVGTVVAGRRHADLRHIIGFFVNQLVLISSPRKEKTFTLFLKEVKNQVLAAFENQDYPLEEAAELLEIKRKPGRHPLFDVVFTLNRLETGNGHREQKETPGEIAGEYSDQNPRVKYDLVLACLERGEILSFSIEYAARLYKEETIRRFIGYFKEIAAAVLQNKHIRLENIQLSSHLVKTDTGPFDQNLEEFEF